MYAKECSAEIAFAIWRMRESLGNNYIKIDKSIAQQTMHKEILAEYLSFIVQIITKNTKVLFSISDDLLICNIKIDTPVLLSPPPLVSVIESTANRYVLALSLKSSATQVVIAQVYNEMMIAISNAIYVERYSDIADQIVQYGKNLYYTISYGDSKSLRLPIHTYHDKDMPNAKIIICKNYAIIVNDVFAVTCSTLYPLPQCWHVLGCEYAVFYEEKFIPLLTKLIANNLVILKLTPSFTAQFIKNTLTKNGYMVAMQESDTLERLDEYKSAIAIITEAQHINKRMVSKFKADSIAIIGLADQPESYNKLGVTIVAKNNYQALLEELAKYG